MTPAIKLTKECSVLFISEPDGIEAFYRRAQAQALREAAAWFAPAGQYDAARVGEHLRHMANELEAQK